MTLSNISHSQTQIFNDCNIKMALSHAQFQTCYYFTFSSPSGPRSKHNQGWELQRYIMKLNRTAKVCIDSMKNPTVRLKLNLTKRAHYKY